MINQNISPIGGYPTGGIANTFTGLGKVLYVTSLNGLDGNDGSVDKPLKTLPKAITLLNSASNPQNRGDTIVLLPGHVEAIDTSNIVNISRLGVSIIGLGTGVRQPQLSLNTAVGSTVTVSVAAVTFQNIRFTANFDNVTAMVTAASTGLTFIDCLFDEGTATNASWSTVVAPSANTANLVDGLSLIRCKVVGNDATDNDIPVNLTGNTANLTVEGSYLKAAVNSTNPLLGCANTAVLSNLLVQGNNLFRLGTSGACLINFQGSGHTGIIAENKGRCAVAAVANVVGTLVCNGAGFLQNFVTGEANKSGILVPAADAD